RLFILQSRTAKRAPRAAIRIAVDMASEGLISREEALRRVTPEQLEQVLAPGFEDSPDPGDILTKGLAVTPGVAVGKAAFTCQDAVAMARRGEKVILVRPNTSPADIAGMEAAVGVVTAVGGSSSHAAIVCRDLGKVGVIGCDGVVVDTRAKRAQFGDLTVEQGEWLSLDGNSGLV
ncbi:MAG: pyruvate, phosphate dikinase, partial [Thermoleophilia bacterium]|nr:pyruvate, phosphate dikinase [Thermoleophilia bacterium]